MTDKSFIKVLERKILHELNASGFQYNEVDKFFYAFYNEIVFKLQLITDRYFKIYFDYGIPIMEKNYELFPKSFLGYLDREINITRWDYSELKKDSSKLELIVNEILFVIKNYCYAIASSIANENSTKFYIDDKFYLDYKEFQRTISPFTNDEQFMMTEYLPKGKTYDEWSVEDDEALYLYIKNKREKEFPFIKFKKQLDSIVEYNLDRYRLDLSQHPEANFKPDKEIKKINIRDLLFDTESGKKLVSFLEDNNYKFYNDNGCYESINRAYFFKEDGSKIFIHIMKHIFMEIEIIKKEKFLNDYLFQYDFNSFTMGWIVGDSKKLDENVNYVISSLKKKL